ncbi:hypothetical protein DSM106972_079250 [Dulcicalothrix desertica PCC 7102]|uniref:ThuA-like domain-containing protein n=1 Tax=Dulcicalothrix desertica PCC 7102 TaxID=232991 RepID=A0A3S1CCR6_9CYAN|nr:hypothetical protein [Dulcicalothrix desertica]RUS99223.1 hypothetical protein DSM106972_079250 [Dulcicalothrix desertica PCC 7102]TWH61075.1 hypothetical protein CAL7102_01156 [Dulcicalothrix desertica PCC 7102]
MLRPIRILLQTTIPTTEDDWSIARFSMLQNYLASLRDESGNALFEVFGRDRVTDIEGNDPILSSLDQSDFDELWLFALDVGEGLTEKDIAGINAFRQRGGGILTTRDHQDMGCSMCGLIDIGDTHYFHTKNPDPDTARLTRDDPYTTYINFPNYHSGANGDYQKITVLEPHELFKNPNSPSGTIEYFPAHPHEGGIGAPANNKYARVIAKSKSIITGRDFNLVVAIDHHQDAQGNNLGRAVTNSSFHHIVDYNWDIEKGCPSFVDEPPGNGMKTEPRALDDIHTYVKNVALWLAN